MTKLTEEARAITKARKRAERLEAARIKRAKILQLAKAGDYKTARYIRTRMASRVAANPDMVPTVPLGAKTGPRTPQADPEPPRKPARGGTIGMNGVSANQWKAERYQHWAKTGRWAHPDDEKR